jgi:hypothetical protein
MNYTDRGECEYLFISSQQQIEIEYWFFFVSILKKNPNMKCIGMVEKQETKTIIDTIFFVSIKSSL